MIEAVRLGRRRGSWPVLLVLVAAFLLAFWLQRSRSRFLRIEAQRPAALALADEFQVPLADVFALRDLVGVEQSGAIWSEQVRAYAERLARGSVAEAARAVARNELEERRFLLLRERFAERSAARH